MFVSHVSECTVSFHRLCCEGGSESHRDAILLIPNIMPAFILWDSLEAPSILQVTQIQRIHVESMYKARNRSKKNKDNNNNNKNHVRRIQLGMVGL